MHLSAGTSQDIVRKWTGHKTEKTMRPYKGITERARKAAMPAIEQFDVFSEKGALSTISHQLSAEMSGLRGFSETNLKMMRIFYEEWENLEANSPVATDEL